MNQRKPGLTEDDLHAYVDGLLDEERRRAVEAWLADDSDAAARVARWQRQNAGLGALFGNAATDNPGDAEHVAKLMRPPRRRGAGWMAAAAAVILFVAGGATGRLTASLPLPAEPPVDLAATLPREAGAAHLIYASEVRHPVEVGADEEAHLVAWLGKKLDHPLATPDLTPLGYHLVGGRLVPKVLRVDSAEVDRLLDAGIVNDHVKRPAGCRDGGDHRVPAFGDGQVRGDPFDRTAGIAVAGLACHGEHMRTGFHIFVNQRAADAAAGPGDQHRFLMSICHRRLPCLAMSPNWSIDEREY